MINTQTHDTKIDNEFSIVRHRETHRPCAVNQHDDNIRHTIIYSIHYTTHVHLQFKSTKVCICDDVLLSRTMGIHNTYILFTLKIARRTHTHTTRKRSQRKSSIRYTQRWFHFLSSFNQWVQSDVCINEASSNLVHSIHVECRFIHSIFSPEMQRNALSGQVKSDEKMRRNSTFADETK